MCSRPPPPHPPSSPSTVTYRTAPSHLSHSNLQNVGLSASRFSVTPSPSLSKPVARQFFLVRCCVPPTPQNCHCGPDLHSQPANLPPPPPPQPERVWSAPTIDRYIVPDRLDCAAGRQTRGGGGGGGVEKEEEESGGSLGEVGRGGVFWGMFVFLFPIWSGPRNSTLRSVSNTPFMTA